MQWVAFRLKMAVHKGLHDLQVKEGLRAANKLKGNHIEWYQQKMKVSLAAETLSR